MPHGSIISEAEAWAAAAAGAFSDGEDQPPQPPPFVSDGLTVSFFRGDTDKPRRGRQQHEAGDPLSGGGLGRPSKEHSGNFGRWGPEAREQWSCCLWDEKEAPKSGDDGDVFGTAITNGGGGATARSSCRSRSGAANGCEAVPPRPGPGGMTTADDVHLVWGGSQYNNASTGSSEKPKVRHDAWGTGNGEGDGEGADNRELWKPMLASRVRGGDSCGGGAAWSLIRQRRRPQTANARMVGRRTAAITATGGSGGNDEIPPGQDKTASGFSGVGGGGGSSGGGSGGGNSRHDIVSNSFRRRLPGSSRPGSAPPPGTRTNRYPNRIHHNPVKRQSSLMSLRSARARAGWQRKRPLPGGSGNGSGSRRSPPTGGANVAISGGRGGGGGGGGVVGAAWHSRSLLSLNGGGGSTYSVYSKGEGRAAAVTPVGDAPTRQWRKEDGNSRRP